MNGGQVNLYLVVAGKEWGYYVFAKSKNRARSISVNHFAEEEYTELRAYSLKKDVGGKTDVIVDCEEDEDYKRVLELGFRFSEEGES